MFVAVAAATVAVARAAVARAGIQGRPRGGTRGWRLVRCLAGQRG